MGSLLYFPSAGGASFFETHPLHVAGEISSISAICEPFSRISRTESLRIISWLTRYVNVSVVDVSVSVMTGAYASARMRAIASPQRIDLWGDRTFVLMLRSVWADLAKFEQGARLVLWPAETVRWLDYGEWFRCSVAHLVALFWIVLTCTGALSKQTSQTSGAHACIMRARILLNKKELE